MTASSYSQLSVPAGILLLLLTLLVLLFLFLGSLMAMSFAAVLHLMAGRGSSSQLLVSAGPALGLLAIAIPAFAILAVWLMWFYGTVFTRPAHRAWKGWLVSTLFYGAMTLLVLLVSPGSTVTTGNPPTTVALSSERKQDTLVLLPGSQTKVPVGLVTFGAAALSLYLAFKSCQAAKKHPVFPPPLPGATIV